MRKIFSLWNIKTDGNVKCGKHLWQQAGMWIGKNFSRVENINSMLRNSQLERQHIVIFIKTLQRFNPYDYSRDLETTTESSSHEKTLQSHDHVHRNRYTNDSRKFHLCFRCYSFHLYINEFNFRLRKTFFIDLEKLLVFFFFFFERKSSRLFMQGRNFSAVVHAAQSATRITRPQCDTISWFAFPASQEFSFQRNSFHASSDAWEAIHLRNRDEMCVILQCSVHESL